MPFTLDYWRATATEHASLVVNRKTIVTGKELLSGTGGANPNRVLCGGTLHLTEMKDKQIFLLDGDWKLSPLTCGAAWRGVA